MSEKILQKVYKASMEFKEGEDLGKFKAVFATLNVKDLDADVTIPGAFVEGQEVIIEPWNHGWELPAGMGAIHADESKAWVDGEFFLETEAGRENYRTVKRLGKLAQWSYTFKIDKASRGEFEGESVQYLEKLDTIGVSPVTRGAGIDTRTESIKGEKGDPDPAAEGAEGETDTGKPSGAYDAELAIIEANLIVLGVNQNG